MCMDVCALEAVYTILSKQTLTNLNRHRASNLVSDTNKQATHVDFMKATSL